MAKKNKMRFVDLDDTNFEQQQNKTVVKEEKNDFDTNITLDDLVEKKEKKIIKEEPKEEKWLKETKLSKEDFEPFKKVESTERKINYEVNYDDILVDEPKKQVLKELFEFNNNEQLHKSNQNNYTSYKEYRQSENEYKNLKPRSTTKTFNEAIRNQERMKQSTAFEENKIKQFLTVKEKLDVKTNIYLKSSIVIKLKELEERTNESRSSIINKLIEIALKHMEE